MSNFTRRDFFGEVFNLTARRSEVKSGLEEYTEPLTRAQVRHLLQRVSFSLSPAVIDKYVGKKATEVVDLLFANAAKNTSPTAPAFTNELIYNHFNFSGPRREQEERNNSNHRGEYIWDLGGWWVTLMKNDRESILEKLTFFWHGHLTTQYAGCNSIPVNPIYLQNDLFRKNHAGNFATLLEKISVDGAMLAYLNGNENINSSPNENYARELLELYALGVGNYTENDVKEAAKVLTGWKVKYYADETLIPNKAYLVPEDFDANSKLFFDEVITVDYEVTQENVYNKAIKKLINVILTKKGDVASRFIMKKMYKFFVYANPSANDNGIINQLAQKLIDEKYEFTPVLKTLLKSKHFFDEQNIGIQLKSPGDTIVNIVGHFKYVDKYARNVMSTLGMELFNPPNVGGWKGYRSWVSTKSLPTTIYYIHEVFTYNTDTDLANWADTIDSSGNLNRLVERILETFLARSVSPERFSEFTAVLASSSTEWASLRNDKIAAGKKIRELMFKVIKTPEFYLS